MTNRYVAAAAMAGGGLGVFAMWACVETFSTDSCPNPDYNHWVNGNPDPCYFLESMPDAGSDAGEAAETAGDATSNVDAATTSDAGDH